MMMRVMWLCMMMRVMWPAQELRNIQNRDKRDIDLEEEMHVMQQGFEQKLRHRDHEIMQLRAENTSLTAQLKGANRYVTLKPPLLAMHLGLV